MQSWDIPPRKEIMVSVLMGVHLAEGSIVLDFVYTTNLMNTTLPLHTLQYCNLEAFQVRLASLIQQDRRETKNACQV